MSTLVLVTGGTGFVGQHCILALVREGYRVRTTMRSLARRDEMVAALVHGGATADQAAGVDVVEADLLEDPGWTEAVDGAEYVLHVASPFPTTAPDDEDELIRPAREGVLRVLRAARDAGVRRVVLTSSFAAIGYGHDNPEQIYDEETWSDPGGPKISAYAKSKALAERAAWDFVEREGGSLELAVVNPVAIFGPALTEDTSSSIAIVRRLLDGSLPAVPKLSFGVVDVRDVADLHVLAMTKPQAAGERFLAISGRFMAMREIAEVLRTQTGPLGTRVTRRVVPDLVVRLLGLVDKEVRSNTGELGSHKDASSAKAQRTLSWAPRPPEEAIVATATSLDDLGLLGEKNGR